MEINEFNIPVPWGHVAVKTWGDKENPPVLVAHGIQDSAAFFDFLIPNLPSIFYYICVDLPGHGKSSHFPPYLPVHALDYVYPIKLILDHFKREKYCLVGHSFGGQISILFSHLYPQYVTKVVLIDTLYFIPTTVENLYEIREIFEKQFALDTSKKPTVYTFDEIVKKVRLNRGIKSVSIDSIVERSLINVGENKYRLSTDPRLKTYVNLLWDEKFVIELLKLYPLQCQVLIIIPKESAIKFVYPSNFYKSVLNELKKHKMFSFKECEGNHDCHLLNPKEVGLLITEFLINHNQSKL